MTSKIFVLPIILATVLFTWKAWYILDDLKSDRVNYFRNEQYMMAGGFSILALTMACAAVYILFYKGD